MLLAGAAAVPSVAQATGQTVKATVQRAFIEIAAPAIEAAVKPVTAEMQVNAAALAKKAARIKITDLRGPPLHRRQQESNGEL